MARVKKRFFILIAPSVFWYCEFRNNLLYCDYRIISSPNQLKILYVEGALHMKPRQSAPGTKNMVGARVVAYRTAQGIKQKDFLARLQVLGIDISATSLSRLEGQYRLVTDFEVVALAKALGVGIKDILE
jgi:hypothetical protein